MLLLISLAGAGCAERAGRTPQASTGAPPARVAEAPRPDAAAIAQVRAYIRRTWETLTRSLADLPAAVRDPKMHRAPGEPWPLYLSPRENADAIRARIDQALAPDQRNTIVLRTLPADVAAVADHGLLYLPQPYVVPGGRFNEMYGWDSYFTAVGLLLDGELERARAMAENHLYQVEYYGMVLNANRTYYLSRSQPPFLARMVRDVSERTGDTAWLRAALSTLERYYTFWTSAPHLAGDTGLSRYFDVGTGPAPEVISDERDAQGRTHYDRVREYYRTHEVTDYDVSRFYDRERDQLTDAFYKGDRSMRESGFDPSNRFGPFSADIVSYAPTCLNSLLYVMETDLADIQTRLGQLDRAAEWRARAERRRDTVNRLLWDDRAGLYFDYNVETGRRRPYEFATTFYPLWAGMATPEQAKRIAANLPRFEAPGGILTSTTRSGSQWDAPFGWAPLQIFAVDGLRRYGFTADADRLAWKFVALVTKEFGEHGVIVEKYDVVRRESDVAAGITYGYSANQVGFGWTNAAYLDLLSGLGVLDGEATRERAPR